MEQATQTPLWDARRITREISTGAIGDQLDAAHLVRPGGYLLFDHWNWCRFIGVSWFPWDLFYNLMPMTRGWIAASGLPLSELRLAGVDPQWWLILQVRRN